jgi:GAF domain
VLALWTGAGRRRQRLHFTILPSTQQKSSRLLLGISTPAFGQHRLQNPEGGHRKCWRKVRHNTRIDVIVRPLLAALLAWSAFGQVATVGDRGIVGVLTLGTHREGAFTPDDLPLLRQVARQIATAVENAVAFGEVTHLKDQATREKLYLEDEIHSELQVCIEGWCAIRRLVGLGNFTQATSHLPPTRLIRIRQFQIDRACPKNCDHDGRPCVFLHAVIMPSMGNAPDETSRGDGYTIVRIKITAAVDPPGARQHNR